MNKYIKKIAKFIKHPVVAVILGTTLFGIGMYFAKQGTFGNWFKQGAEIVSEGSSDGGLL